MTASQLALVPVLVELMCVVFSVVDDASGLFLPLMSPPVRPQTVQPLSVFLWRQSCAAHMLLMPRGWGADLHWWTQTPCTAAHTGNSTPDSELTAPCVSVVLPLDCRVYGWTFFQIVQSVRGGKTEEAAAAINLMQNISLMVWLHWPLHRQIPQVK